MRRSLRLSIAGLAALGVSTLGTLGGDSASAARWGKNYFPNLPLVSHEGETLRFFDDLIEGKMVVINFVYANCPDTCPLTTARLARVQDQLGDRVGRDIFMYSITLDPERDTPEVLKKHAQAYNIKPGWLFLTGKPEDVNLIRYKLGERSRTLSEHRADVVLGNATTGEWMRSSVFQDLGQLVMEIRDLDPVWRAQMSSKPAVNNYADAKPLDLAHAQPGQALFLKACASCHSIGKGDLVGPDLKGLTARRDRAWLVRYMMTPSLMLAQQDPIAVALAAKYEGATMPYLGLKEPDVADLLAYVDAETKRLGALAGIAEPPHDHDSHDHQLLKDGNPVVSAGSGQPMSDVEVTQ